MTTGDDYTVAIPTHYRPTLLDGLLESLLQQTASFDELLVVDPGDEESSEVIRKRLPEFESEGVDVGHYHRRPDTDTLQEIRNRIIELASGDVLCFLDDDTVCTERWLESVKRTYERDPAVVCVGGPAIRADTDLNPSNDLIETDDKLNSVSKYGFVTDMSGRWVPSSPTEVDVCRGANMTFRKSTLEAVGGFDPEYGGPGAFEEWDVMVKVGRRGRIVYHPDAFVYHIESERGGSRLEYSDGPPGTYWFARNSVRFRKQNFPETYRHSLLKQCFGSERSLPPMWRRLERLLVRGETEQIPWIRGFLHGVRGVRLE